MENDAGMHGYGCPLARGVPVDAIASALTNLYEPYAFQDAAYLGVGDS